MNQVVFISLLLVAFRFSKSWFELGTDAITFNEDDGKTPNKNTTTTETAGDGEMVATTAPSTHHAVSRSTLASQELSRVQLSQEVATHQTPPHHHFVSTSQQTVISSAPNFVRF